MEVKIMEAFQKNVSSIGLHIIILRYVGVQEIVLVILGHLLVCLIFGVLWFIDFFFLLILGSIGC